MDQKTVKARRIHFSQLILGIAVILLVIFATYYLMVHLPKIRTTEHQRELEKIEAQKQKELEVIEAREHAQEEEDKRNQVAAEKKLVEEYNQKKAFEQAKLEERYRQECVALKNKNLSQLEEMLNACNTEECTSNILASEINDPKFIGSNFIQACTNNKLKGTF